MINPFPRPKNELLSLEYKMLDILTRLSSFLLEMVWHSDILCIHCHDTMTNTQTNCIQNHQINKEKMSSQHTPSVLSFRTWNFDTWATQGFVYHLNSCILSPTCPFWSPRFVKWASLFLLRKGPMTFTWKTLRKILADVKLQLYTWTTRRFLSRLHQQVPGPWKKMNPTLHSGVCILCLWGQVLTKHFFFHQRNGKLFCTHTSISSAFYYLKLQILQFVMSNLHFY